MIHKAHNLTFILVKLWLLFFQSFRNSCVLFLYSNHSYPSTHSSRWFPFRFIPPFPSPPTPLISPSPYMFFSNLWKPQQLSITTKIRCFHKWFIFRLIFYFLFFLEKHCIVAKALDPQTQSSFLFINFFNVQTSNSVGYEIFLVISIKHQIHF